MNIPKTLNRARTMHAPCDNSPKGHDGDSESDSHSDGGSDSSADTWWNFGHESKLKKNLWDSVGSDQGDEYQSVALLSTPLARAIPLSEQQWVLFPQLLQPCPALPFTNTPPPPLVRATVGAVSVKFWEFGVASAGQ